MDYSSYQAQQDYLCIMAPVFIEGEGEPLFAEVPRAQIPKLQFPLSQICCHSGRFELHHPIGLLLYPDEGVWVCEWSGIVSAGPSPEEAAISFCEDFTVFWDEIAHQPDESLSKKAQATKQDLLSVVKSWR